jgi:hypothetical protein
VGIRCADHATPTTRKSLALTSPTSGGRSVGIVRLRTKASVFSFSLVQIRFSPIEILCETVFMYCRRPARVSWAEVEVGRGVPRNWILM